MTIMHTRVMNALDAVELAHTHTHTHTPKARAWCLGGLDLFLGLSRLRNAIWFVVRVRMTWGYIVAPLR